LQLVQVLDEKTQMVLSRVFSNVNLAENTKVIQ